MYILNAYDENSRLFLQVLYYERIHENFEWFSDYLGLINWELEICNKK